MKKDRGFEIQKDDFWFYCFFSIIMIYAVVRCFFGIEITDEAYYIAEARTALDGNIPYALNNSFAVGQVFLMLPLLKVYTLFSPDLEGVFECVKLFL